MWRAQVRALPAARDLDVPTLNDHIPSLLAELASALRAGSDETIAEALLDATNILQALRLPSDTELDAPIAPRGYRLISRIPRLPDGVIERIVAPPLPMT